MRIEEIRSLAALREGLDRMIDRVSNEIVDTAGDVAEARERRRHLKNLRAALDRPPATEPRR